MRKVVELPKKVGGVENGVWMAIVQLGWEQDECVPNTVKDRSVRKDADVNIGHNDVMKMSLFLV